MLDSGEALDHLTEAERAWVRRSEELWTQAHRIAGAYPSIDAGDVYHSLRCLELSPSERLARGLSRALAVAMRRASSYTPGIPDGTGKAI